MSSQHSPPLSDSELMALDAFLLAGEDDDARLPIDEAHGFITAMIVARQSLDEGDWLEAIWGEPVFSDAAEQQSMKDLLLRMRDEIAVTLESRQPFEPMVIEEEEDGEVFEVYEGWCLGFMLGVANNQEQWETLPSAEQDLLRPIATLALLRTEEEQDLDEEEYAMCVELLPGSVAGLYAFWAKNS